MSQTEFERLAVKVTERLEEQRCPCCGALLFRADAEGQVEIKCRKCGRIIKRTLTAKKPLTGSPTEGQGQFESPKRPVMERWGNDMHK
jgi:phage FluMu protein Com